MARKAQTLANGESSPGSQEESFRTAAAAATIGPHRAEASGLGDRAAIGTTDLDSLDGALLRRRWRAVIGRHPPKTLSRALMIRILTWREQIMQVGDIDSRTRAILAASLGVARPSAVKAPANYVPSTASRAGAAPKLKMGSTLVREHAGVPHRVRVVPGGFEWDQRAFGSLSAVAKAITGVNWNGRRFFGLDRDRSNGDHQRKRRDSEPGRPLPYPLGEERPT